MQTMYDALADQGIRPPRGRFWGRGDTQTLCPRCSPARKKKTAPCLTVTITQEAGADEKAVWFCHHCEWTGWTGTGRFAKARNAGRIYRRPNVTPPAEPQQAVIEWLASRGIPEAIVRTEGIWAALTWMPGCEGGEKVPTIAFPFREDGELLNVKYRDPKQKRFRQEKDAKPIPYRRDAIRGAKEVWIVEGEIDALSLLVVGKASVISPPAGAPKKEVAEDSPKFAWIDTIHEDLEAAERVYIATDADEPGQALQREIIRRVGRNKSWIVEWPEGINDANAMLLQHGAEALAATLNGAAPVPVEGEVTVGALWKAIETLHAGASVEWFSTGIAGMDDFYRVLPGQITVVTGYAHDGKSSVIDQVMVNMALRYGWKFAIFSPEHDAEQHVISLLEKAAQAPFFDGPSPRMTLDEVRSWRGWLEEHFHFIRWERKPGQRGRPTADWVLGQVEYMVRRYGVNGFLIDPFNRISQGDFQRETEFILDLLDAMQHTAKATQTHGWIVAHPAKQQRDRSGKRPAKLGLQDISGSANWDNCTDMGLLVRRIWHNEVTDQPYAPHETPLEVECLKARSKHSGLKGGSLRLRYRRADGTLLPLTDSTGAWHGGEAA